MKKCKLIIALDLDINSAYEVFHQLKKHDVIFKIGYQLFPVGGYDLACDILKEGRNVFFDLKLLDIGKTVERGISSLYSLIEKYESLGNDFNFLTIHAQGNAVKFAKNIPVKNLKMIAVSVLTDIEKQQIQHETNLSVDDLVLQRCKYALLHGADGIVSSGQEVEKLRGKLGNDFLIITPAIRRGKDKSNDQKRITTVKDAVMAGSNYLVVGRPIIDANDREKETIEFLHEIDECYK